MMHNLVLITLNWLFKTLGRYKSPLRRLLTTIISHSDRQLLENKSSFTICSIHILCNSNKFHKFWMSFDFRRTQAKRGQNWAKSQADRPLLGQPAWHCWGILASRINPQAHGYRCSFHLRVFQGLSNPQGTCAHSLIF